MENNINKKISELEVNKDIAGLEEIKQEAEATFEGGIAGLAEQAIARLNTKVEEITPIIEITEGQKTQVETLGGSESGVQEVAKPIDEKIIEKDAEIKNVETETEQKIEEVKAGAIEQINEAKFEKNIDRDLIKIGSIFDCKMGNGQIIEVEIMSEIQKTNDIKPREYIRVKATHGNLETDIEIKNLIEKETIEKTQEIKNESRLSQLKNLKQNPQFVSLLEEANKYQKMKRTLKEGTDKSIRISDVQNQEQNFDTLKQSIAPNIGLSSLDIIKIDQLIDAQKKVEENKVD